MFNPELRKRLSDISRGKSAPITNAPEPSATSEYSPAFDFSGREVEIDSGRFFISEYKMSDFLPEAAEIAQKVADRQEIQGQAPQDLLFLDLETCGLSNVPVFLVGTMQLSGSDFIIRQYFARDYSEESSMLDHTCGLLKEAAGLVTFNGKSFDVPFLRDRMIFHRLRLAETRVHLDLLMPARRKWRGILPNCRLQTLEKHICGRRRVDDVPGARIPALYHAYVRNGNISPLIPVFKHNVLDLMTMAELLPAIE